MGFKRTLLQDVKLFVVDAVAFRHDWEANGPTVPGLDPMDATDRLRKFQQLFEVRGRGAARRGGLCWQLVACMEGAIAWTVHGKLAAGLGLPTVAGSNLCSPCAVHSTFLLAACLSATPPPPQNPCRQVRKRKWDSYSSGEELFGLPVTQYPELERTQEEIVMLDKLYR